MIFMEIKTVNDFKVTETPNNKLTRNDNDVLGCVKSERKMATFEQIKFSKCFKIQFEDQFEHFQAYLYIFSTYREVNGQIKE